MLVSSHFSSNELKYITLVFNVDDEQNTSDTDAENKSISRLKENIDYISNTR